jgi:hypothetical protein
MVVNPPPRKRSVYLLFENGAPRVVSSYTALGAPGPHYSGKTGSRPVLRKDSPLVSQPAPPPALRSFNCGNFTEARDTRSRGRQLDTIFRDVAISDRPDLTMTMPFEAYSRTARGQRLAAIIYDPHRYLEYRAFTRERFAAVTALVSLVRPELEPLRRTNPREFTVAKQYVGWALGVVMRNHGHEVVGRSRVPGKLFTMGAIWSAEPAAQSSCSHGTPRSTAPHPAGRQQRPTSELELASTSAA